MEGTCASSGSRHYRKQMCFLHTLSHLYSASGGWQSPGGWQSHDMEEVLVPELPHRESQVLTRNADLGLLNEKEIAFFIWSQDTIWVSYNILAHLNLIHDPKYIPQTYDKRSLSKVQEEDKIPRQRRPSFSDYI